MFRTALNMIFDLLKDFRANPATAEELREPKAYLIGSFAIGSETPAQVAGRVLTTGIYVLPTNYWDTYREKVAAIIEEDLKAAVGRQIQRDKMTMVTVGNAGGVAKELDGMGPARTIKFSELDIVTADLTRAKATLGPATAESLEKGKTPAAAALQALGGREKVAGIKDLSMKIEAKLRWVRKASR